MRYLENIKSVFLRRPTYSKIFVPLKHLVNLKSAKAICRPNGHFGKTSNGNRLLRVQNRLQRYIIGSFKLLFNFVTLLFLLILTMFLGLSRLL